MSEIKTPKVLIIDDEPGIRDLLSIELKERGYEVHTAVDGEAGLLSAEKLQPEIIICDVRMPRRDGISTLKEIKARGLEAEVIMLTGFGTLNAAIECMKLGAYDFVTKPTRSDDLDRLIRKALEKKSLHQKVSQLETLNRLKTEFLSMMSHELRTPMNTVIGFTELLLKETYGPLVTEQMDALRRIESSGHQLLELINNLLDLSKLEAERMPLFLTTFELGPLIDEISTTLEPQATGRGLKYVVKIEDHLHVLSDRLRLKQVIINLVGNAIKFTSKGSVTIQADTSNDEIKIMVHDTGVGIPAEQFAKIFDEFYQLDPSFTRDFGGSGLGLAIVKKIVGLLGGQIHVESLSGKGSTFTVSLPQMQASPAGTKENTAEIGSPPRPVAEATTKDVGCVVIVDDDVSAIKIMQDMLKGVFRVKTVSDGSAALTVVKAERPIAITLDLMMPVQSGWTLLKDLKKDPATKDIPVIITSSSEDHEAAFHMGAAAYLVKPVNRDELLATLNKIVRRRN